VDYVARRCRSFKVQFSGGEPLLHLPLVERVIDYLRSHPAGIAFQLQTNATLVDRAIARRLRGLGLALGVSLDGPPAVNDTLRPLADGRGSTVAVMRGLERLAAERMKVGITAVLTAQSIGSLPRLVDLCAYAGNVHGLSLDLVRPLGRAGTGEVAPPEPAALEQGVRAALERAEELARLGAPRVRFREVERLVWLRARGRVKDRYCLAARGESLAVTPDGSVYPCASLAGRDEFYLGNVGDPDFSPMEALRHAVWFGRSAPAGEGCRACPVRSWCGGGCLARAYAYHRRPDLPYEGECRMRRTFWQWVTARGEGLLPGLPLRDG